MAQHMIGQS
jgi:DNA-directed RNA polymerase II subunit RPB2